MMIDLTVEEAKRVIREDTPDGNVAARLEALEVAMEIFGPDIRMTEVYKWADGNDTALDG